MIIIKFISIPPPPLAPTPPLQPTNSSKRKSKICEKKNIEINTIFFIKCGK